MDYLRTTLIFEVCQLPNQQELPLHFIPEIAYIQNYLLSKHGEKKSKRLQGLFKQLAQFERTYGKGILNLTYKKSKRFVHQLYREMLACEIPLPPNLSEKEIKFLVKDYSKYHKNFSKHQALIKIPHQDLSFCTKYFPWVGTLMSTTLTLGLTITTLIPLVGWGISFLIFAFFALSKFFTIYADIKGGPEKRLQKFGNWLDRVFSRKYQSNFCLSRMVLFCLTTGMLGCSTLLSAMGSWHMIICLSGISAMPSFLTFSLAALFVSSSAGSSFGRIYESLYDIMFHLLSPYLSFDNTLEKNKLKMSLLSKQLFKRTSSVQQKPRPKAICYLCKKPSLTSIAPTSQDGISPRHLSKGEPKQDVKRVSP